MSERIIEIDDNGKEVVKGLRFNIEEYLYVGMDVWSLIRILEDVDMLPEEAIVVLKKFHVMGMEIVRSAGYDNEKSFDLLIKRGGDEDEN